jgi:hypothetical protein
MNGVVAQTFSLPYRRVPLGQATEPNAALISSGAPQNGILRYGRVETLRYLAGRLPGRNSAVAQTFSLPYRRVPLGQATEPEAALIS